MLRPTAPLFAQAFLRKLEGGLRGISHVIVDEIHERTSYGFPPGRPARYGLHSPDLKVILMSATIDTTLSTYFQQIRPDSGGAGRTYPVTEYYLEDCIQITNFVPPPNTKEEEQRK